MNELLTAASVLLAITGVLYAMWHDDILGATSMVMPQHYEDREAFKKHLQSVFWSKAIPLCVATLCISMVYLPPTISIAIASTREYALLGLKNVNNYDPIATSFVLVEAFTAVLATQSIVYVWKILSKLRASER